MTKRQVETMLPINADRGCPPAALAEMCRTIRDSGVVDYAHAWDQMMGWWPKHLWTTENTPMAAFIKDMDSIGDAVAVSAFAAASAPGLGVTISPDAIRYGPAEMVQSMLTLANFGIGTLAAHGPWRRLFPRAAASRKSARIGALIRGARQPL